MAHLSIETQGIKGATTNKKVNLGYVQTFLKHEQDYISVDNFEGQGATYKQREQPEIKIVQNGEELFKGTKYELFELLRKTTV